MCFIIEGGGTLFIGTELSIFEEVNGSLTLPGLAPTPGRISGPSEASLLGGDPGRGVPGRRPRNVKEG
eukprot:1177926-Prorocentrum_minimum.AAC.5